MFTTSKNDPEIRLVNKGYWSVVEKLDTHKHPIGDDVDRCLCSVVHTRSSELGRSIKYK